MKRRLLLLIAAGISGFLYASDGDSEILKNRTGIIVIQTRPGAKVAVEQINHEFWFGAALANGMFSPNADSAAAQMYQEKFLENFNCAVTENALKWLEMEPVQGQVNFRIVDNILAFSDQHQIPLRGHNIYWGVSWFIQDWVEALSPAALEGEIKKRARTIAARYRGRFEEYDLNNEMIHGNYYEEQLGKGITKKMVNWILEEDPNAKLYLNDYDILTMKMARPFAAHIQDLLDQNIPIAGLGVQGHLHGETFNPDSLTAALDMLARFELPIRITEFNMPGQNSAFYKDKKRELTEKEELQKASNLTEYFRICFAHPAVEGILFWGFWEKENWIPASSLYKADWTPTPALHAYQDLVFNQWWTKTEKKADKEGLCSIRAFYGRHKIRCGNQEIIVKLEKDKGCVTAVLQDF